jgi:hypothetical protein
LASDLNQGRYKPASGITWADFRQRDEGEVLTGLAPNTADKAAGVFNAVESLLPTVMPQVLMVLMRHESIQTTMRYYVGRNAEATADAAWAAYHQEGPVLGPSSPNRASSDYSTIS